MQSVHSKNLSDKRQAGSQWKTKVLPERYQCDWAVSSRQEQ